MNKSMLGLLAITILSGAVLLSNASSAESSTSNASVTVPEACTMTGSGMNSHTATITPGTFSAASGSDYENGIGKTTFTVVCNDYNGFAIYAIGYTGDSYDDTNHTKLVGSNTNVAIDTAVYSSGDTTSSWSMKVNKVTDSTISYLPANMSIQNSFDSWHTIPDTYTKVAQYKASTGSSTTDTTLGAKIDTTYAAFIAPNQPGDTYMGQVKYTMVHPYTEQPIGPQIATSGCINYFPNGSNVEGTMGCQSATDGNDIDLLASNFSRTGYGFAGWSDKFDYATNSEAHFYGPQETITIPTGTTANGLSLYAIWIPSVGSLQDSSKVSELCGTGSTGGSLTAAVYDNMGDEDKSTWSITAGLSSISALTDDRDNNTYAIAKLADDNCWMIENLRLEAENTRTAEKQILAQGYGTSVTYGNFSGLADAESANFTASQSSATDATTANSLYYAGTQSGTATIDISQTSYAGYRMPRYNNLNTQSRASNPTSNRFTNNNTTGGMYSYGNYYTWSAAMANTNYYTSSNNSEAAGTSICPTNWHLPSSNGIAKEYNALSSNYGGTGSNQYGTNTGGVMSKRFRTFPNNFLYSGFFRDSSTYSRGSNGYYWSRSTYAQHLSYALDLDYISLYPSYGNMGKQIGFSVRCVTGA